MKILIIDPADFLGGAELFTVDVVRALAREIDFVVLTTGTEPEYVSRLPENVHVYQTPLPRLRPFRPLLFLRTLAHLRKIVASESPDIVHTNSVRGSLFGPFLGKVWTHFAHDFTFPKNAALLLNRARQVYTCSAAVRQDLVQKGVVGSRVSVVANGVDLSRFVSLRNKKRDYRQPVVSIAGRIDLWKGQDIFLKAAKILRQKLPSAQLRIYGESSAHDEKTRAYEKQLRQFKKTQQLDNVRFCGFLPIEAVLAETDILVHASTMPEPFGRVIIEAMAAGVPVIASDLGGPREILAGDVLSQALIEPEDPCLLAERIIALADDAARRNQLKEAGYVRVKDFGIKAVASRLRQQWEKAAVL